MSIYILCIDKQNIGDLSDEMIHLESDREKGRGNKIEAPNIQNV